MGAAPRPMTLITSRSNPKIKLVRSLHHRKYRQEHDLFLVEGIHHVGQLVEAAASPEASFSVDSIYFAPDLLTSEYAVQLVQQQGEAGIPCYSTSPDVFASIAEKDNPQGILALARPAQLSLADLSPMNFPWAVALVSAQDPGNIGTTLRTIDAVGASGLLLLESGADPYHPSAVRASMGAFFWHPVLQTSFARFADWAKKLGYHVYGSSAHGETDYRQLSHWERPAILLLGSEQKGLTDEQQAACEKVYRLPMRGRVSSLNLAVAAGIMLYEMRNSDTGD